MIKKTFTSFAVLLLFAAYHSYCQTTDPTPYCSGQYTYGWHAPDGYIPYISDVQIGTMDHFSGDSLLPAPYYIYYNNVAAPELEVGNTYPLTLTFNDFPGAGTYLAACIDCTQESVFENNEAVPLDNILNIGGTIPSPFNITVTIPANAVAGTTRMRVLYIEDGPEPGDTMACTSNGFGGYKYWGETKDYNIKIVPHTTSINDVASTTRNLIYPNPATSTVYLKNIADGSRFVIYDIQGKTVLTGKTKDSKIDIAS